MGSNIDGKRQPGTHRPWPRVSAALRHLRMGCQQWCGQGSPQACPQSLPRFSSFSGAVLGLVYMGDESPGRRPEPHPEKRGSELSARPCPELLPTSGFYGSTFWFLLYSLGAAGENPFPCRFPPLEAVHTPPSCHSGPYLGRTNVPLVPPAPSCPNSWASQKITSDWAVGLRGGASSHPGLSVPTPSTGFRNTFSTRCFVLLGCQIYLDGWHSRQEQFISPVLHCSSNARGLQIYVHFCVASPAQASPIFH